MRRRDRRRTTSLAFAGAGTITVVHGLAAQAAGMPVAAVASRTPERAAERAHQVGAVACAYDALPSGAEAVVVATPPAQHVDQAVLAMERGAAVLVEKPLATTLADADRLVDAEQRTGRPVVYGENLAFAPPVRAALDAIAGLGPLGYLEARALQPRPDWGGFLEPSWGGGVLFDLGVHPLALVLLAAGADEPVAVRAELATGEGSPVDDHAVVELHLASGARARVEASWRHPEATWDLQASSDTGVVRLELLPEPAMERDGEPVPLPPPRGGTDPRIEALGYVDQLGALAAAVDGAAEPIGARFGRDVLEVVCAAYRSAHDGTTVRLPYDGPRDRTPLELWRGG